MPMYIIREVFTAKPGQASKLARLFKKMPDSGMKSRVLTDMVGPYNTVIMETEAESLAAWEEEMKRHRSGQPDPNMDPELLKEMANYTSMYDSGRREIFQIFE